jgi:hypothetical protein
LLHCDKERDNPLRGASERLNLAVKIKIDKRIFVAGFFIDPPITSHFNLVLVVAMTINRKYKEMT